MSRLSALLFSRMVLRTDAFALQNPEGKYFVARLKGQDLALTHATLNQHIEGELCVGTYVVQRDRCKLVALDIDGIGGDPKNCEQATRALIRTAQHFEFPPLVEFSGKKGYRLWWLTETIPAVLARTVGSGIIREAGEAGQDGCAEVVVFPKQCRISPGSYGNLLKLPWGKRVDNGKRGVFVDPETLEPYPKEDQAGVLESAPIYTEAFLTELCEFNGWEAEPEPEEKSSTPVHESNNGLLSRGFAQELPCYALLSSDNPPSIPQGHRNNVLFAIASQERRMGTSHRASRMSLRQFNSELCQPPLPEREVDRIWESVSGSTTTSAGCDILQRANLCPVLLTGLVCPIFKAKSEKREIQQAQLSADETRLTITPLYVTRTRPPLYTATVNGRPVSLTLDQLGNFTKFQLACIAAIDYAPILPKIVSGEKWVKKDGKWRSDGDKYLSPREVWTEMVNEALESVIEEDSPPEDASADGVAWGAVEEFIEQRRRSEIREDLLKGNILTENGRFHFRGRDLHRHLKLTSSNILKENELWVMLRKRGGTNQVLRTKRGLVRVWSVPTSQFEETMGNQDTPNLDVPPVSFSAFEKGSEGL